MEKLKLRPIDWTIIGIGLACYIPLTYAIFTYDGAGQSFATWIMWSVLDLISLYVALKNKKSYPVILAFTIGGIVITTSLILKQKIFWDNEATIVSLAVLLSMSAGYYYVEVKKNLYWATIWTTVAQIVAGIPLILQTYQHPDSSVLLPYSGFLIINVLSLISADAWTIEDRFFSGCFTVSNIIILIPLIRELLK